MDLKTANQKMSPGGRIPVEGRPTTMVNKEDERRDLTATGRSKCRGSSLPLTLCVLLFHRFVGIVG